jgi:hypothetical protein
MNATTLAAPPSDVKDEKLDDQLRDAVGNVMSATSAAPKDFARVHEILERKAAQMRAPFVEKLRRIKETA